MPTVTRFDHQHNHGAQLCCPQCSWSTVYLSPRPEEAIRAVENSWIEHARRRHCGPPVLVAGSK
jgi:hypothetical protein